MATYQSNYTGAQIDSAIGNVGTLQSTVSTLNTSVNNKLSLSGGTIDGQLVIRGGLGENPLIVRGITGSDGTGNSGDLYLNYNGGTVFLAKSGASRVEENGAIYGAVWNDYAEFRSQREIIEPGYCVASADNGQVYLTTERLQACDGIVSDTFGFSIGETDECKTPLAVAGRVLAYCEGNCKDYHSGDTVCAGPDGKVCKMTREEIREWPDRIVGIVSEIPDYKIWGDGNIPVNGRIWIKVK